LDEMCNLDKHRRIPANATGIDFVLHPFNPSDLSSGLISIEATDECHIVRVPLSMKNQVQLNPSPTVIVEFGGDISGISETPQSITEIYDFVANDVLPRFESFFL